MTCANCCKLQIGDRVQIIQPHFDEYGEPTAPTYTGTTGQIDGFYKKNAVIVHLDRESAFDSEDRKHFVSAMVCSVDSLEKVESSEGGDS